MPRDTSTDTLTADAVNRYVPILSLLNGWGIQADNSKAVYAGWALPLPREPFPAAYVYVAGQTHDYQQGTGSHRDTTTIMIRIVGGPATPNFRFNPELTVYGMITGVVNELSYRRFLEDPTNNDEPFRYIDSEGKLKVGAIGRITAFNYGGDQGLYAGIDIPTTVGWFINIGRIG